MNTLHEHLREMLYAIDEQVKIPNTRLHGAVWVEYYNGVHCTMCAAGAWYAQKFGRHPLIDPEGPVRDVMRLMDLLRKGEIWVAYKTFYGCSLDLNVPVNVFGGDSMAMDAGWRESMDALLIWLTEHDL